MLHYDLAHSQPTFTYDCIHIKVMTCYVLFSYLDILDEMWHASVAPMAKRHNVFTFCKNVHYTRSSVRMKASEKSTRTWSCSIVFLCVSLTITSLTSHNLTYNDTIPVSLTSARFEYCSWIVKKLPAT